MKESLDKAKKKALSEVKKEIEELFGIAYLNVKNCPWVAERSVEDYIKELESEIKELREEVEKGSNEGIEEEVGDVFWDALMLLYIAHKNRKANKKKALRIVAEKIKRRKPWLIEGRKVGKQEAMDIWNAAKKMEKKR
ncbi:MAG: MazG nucleotide pyrophosphohydrolase domain-containing protein [Candidatus Anstonellales archaeon]